MSIGLYDYDMKQYAPFPFNLEIMKLASYYKKHNQLVSLAPEFLPDNYTKFIIRKDTQDGRPIDDISPYDNIEYGGYYFTNGIVVPLPEEIELCGVDPTIYNKFKPTFDLTRTGRKRWKTFNNANHLKLSLNGKDVWNKYLEPINFHKFYRVTFIHDFDVSSIEGARDAIKDIYKQYRAHDYKGSSYLGFKFPIQISSIEEMDQWYKLVNGHFSMFMFQYNGILSNEELLYMKNTYGLASPKLIYNICIPDGVSDEKFSEIVSKIYQQTVFLRQNHSIFSLKIGKNFPFPSQWEKVLHLWNCWLKQGTDIHRIEAIKQRAAYETLYAFCVTRTKSINNPNRKKDLPVEQTREAFTFIGNNYPKLFYDFYTLNNVILDEGGNVICQKRTSQQGLISK